MKQYTLTNTSKGFLFVLEERNISHLVATDGKTVSVWLPSDQDLFILAQEYEYRREELNAIYE